MKNISEFLNECLVVEGDKVAELEKKLNKVEKKAEDAEAKAKQAEDDANKAEESIKDEKSFREFAKAKFEEVFGDDLDEKKMNDTIDGLLKDNADAVKAGEWGKLAGMLNKSFGK